MTQDLLLSFLADELNVDTRAIGPQTKLFSTGRVDSCAMVDLVAYLEHHCDMVLSPREIKLSNLDTVAQILRFLGTRDA